MRTVSLTTRNVCRKQETMPCSPAASQKQWLAQETMKTMRLSPCQSPRAGPAVQAQKMKESKANSGLSALNIQSVDSVSKERSDCFLNKHLAANIDMLHMVNGLAAKWLIATVLQPAALWAMSCGMFEVVRPSCYQYSTSVSPTPVSKSLLNRPSTYKVVQLSTWCKPAAIHAHNRGLDLPHVSSDGRNPMVVAFRALRLLKQISNREAACMPP